MPMIATAESFLFEDAPGLTKKSKEPPPRNGWTRSPVQKSQNAKPPRKHILSDVPFQTATKINEFTTIATEDRTLKTTLLTITAHSEFRASFQSLELNNIPCCMWFSTACSVRHARTLRSEKQTNTKATRFKSSAVYNCLID